MTKSRPKGLLFYHAIRGILQWIREKIGKSSEIDRAIYLWNKAYNQASRNATNAEVHNEIAQNADNIKYSAKKYGKKPGRKSGKGIVYSKQNQYNMVDDGRWTAALLRGRNTQEPCRSLRI